MKLATACVILGAATAHAEATFDEFSATVKQRAAAQLVEDRCDVDVELRGAFATIETRERILNPGPEPLAALLQLPLPAGGQVTRFATRGDRGLAVDAHAPSVEGASDVLGVDPAVLQREDEGSYRIVLQPLAPDHDALLETTVVALARPRGGMLRLVLPGRDGLAACRGNVRATPGPGARIKAIHVAGDTTPGARAALVLEAKDLVIDFELEVAGTQPIAWTQTQPLAAGYHATLLTVFAPRVRASGARKVVFVVDGSRSMDLVGRHNVVKAIQRLGAALPKDAEIEAILYDREVTRVLGALRPATTATLTAITDAVAKRPARNGSDLVAAFAKTREVLANARGQAMIVVITDGVTPDITGSALIDALGARTSTADVHAIVLDPADTQAPGAEVLRAPINLLGGTYVEVAAEDLDTALVDIDEWLRPAWLEVAAGDAGVPTEVKSGGGFTHVAIHKGPAARFTVSGRGELPFRAAARPAPAVPAIAAYALASAGPVHLVEAEAPASAAIEAAVPLFEKLRAQHPVADATFAFAILTSAGKVARSRKQMVAGGGKYERVIAVADPSSPPLAAPTSAAGPIVRASAIAKPTLERLFRDQLQPKAFACYQRALGKNAQLAGTATFAFTMGRGEVTEVKVAGLGDAAFDACLVDAAYQLSPPLPDFAINADDQTLASYPLTFARRVDQQATIVLGDADSTSPIDIDAIQGGIPRRPTKQDTFTPLGRMRP